MMKMMMMMMMMMLLVLVLWMNERQGPMFLLGKIASDGVYFYF